MFVEHCTTAKNEARLEAAALPVVTAFAFHIQDAYNGMLEVLQEIETAKLLRAGLDDDEGDEELDEELAKREVIMGELLRIMLKLDYGDEIGRRKVFSVVSECCSASVSCASTLTACQRICLHTLNSPRG